MDWLKTRYIRRLRKPSFDNKNFWDVHKSSEFNLLRSNPNHPYRLFGLPHPIDTPQPNRPSHQTRRRRMSSAQSARKSRNVDSSPKALRCSDFATRDSRTSRDGCKRAIMAIVTVL